MAKLEKRTEKRLNCKKIQSLGTKIQYIKRWIGCKRVLRGQWRE